MIKWISNNWQDWICSLNLIEIIIAAIVGIITGYIASKIYAKSMARVIRKQMNRKFKSLEGSYIRWYKEDKLIGNNRVFAKAHLNHYRGENRVAITVETLMHENGNDLENRQEWTGEVVMDTIKSGTIVWEQIIPDNGNNGFKRIIVDRKEEKITIVGESDQGFDIERFTEKIKNAS